MNKNNIILLLSLSLLFLGLYIYFEVEELPQQYREYYNFYSSDNDDSCKDVDDYFSGLTQYDEKNPNLLVSALSSVMKYPIYKNKSDDNGDVIWQEIKFDEIYKLNLIGDKLSLDKNQPRYNHNQHITNDNDKDCSFNIKIKKFYGRILHLKGLRKSTTIKELKLKIKKILRTDTNLQRIVFNGRKVIDEYKDLQYYGIKKNSILHLDILPFSSSSSKNKKEREKKNITFKRFIDSNLINKLYNNSFVSYAAPLSSQCNWVNFVIDKKQNIPRNWKISYHGTSRFKHNSIADQGNILLGQLRRQEQRQYRPSPFNNNESQNFNHLIKYSNGIFTTPDLQLAELYGKIFYFEGERYKVIFQHLVKEKSLVKIKRFNNRNGRLDEYWVSPCENELKPVGILIKKVENCA